MKQNLPSGKSWFAQQMAEHLLYIIYLSHRDVAAKTSLMTRAARLSVCGIDVLPKPLVEPVRIFRKEGPLLEAR